MKLTLKHTLVPGATALAAATLFTTGLAQNNGNAGAATGHAPTTATAPSQGDHLVGAGATQIGGISPQGADTAAYVVNVGGSSSSPGTVGIDHGSGLSRQPGTRNLFVGGGMLDGGNVYIGGLGGSVMVGPSGFGNVAGLAFNPADGSLYGTATASVLTDGLISINPATGAGTLVGGGMGIGGMDAIAFNPADGVLYGSTGFFYDGSPGDVITIDPGTGVATDTGIDMSPAPGAVVAGMAFADDGTGYVSFGGGGVGAAGAGSIHEWDLSTHSLTQIASPTGGSSMSDIEVLR